MTRRRPGRWLPAAAVLTVALLGGCAATRPSTIVDFSSRETNSPAAASSRPMPVYSPESVPAYALQPALQSRPWHRPSAVRERPAAEARLPASGLYRVKHGDTVHRIARRYDLDYKDLVAWNNLSSPYVLHVGQTIRLTPGQRPRHPQEKLVPETPLRRATEPARVEGHETRRHPPEVGQEAAAGTAAAPLAIDKKNAHIVRQGPAQPAVEKGGITWEWPAAGRVIKGFNDSGNAKGVDIAGKMGEPVYAAASGTVVYSGSGLRGYGQLIIIKHSKTYLSAYAHNHRLLVKEGQHVKRGQEIAEMGNTDADQTKLHFEIRRQGKPVDPLHYLPTDRAL